MNLLGGGENIMRLIDADKLLEEINTINPCCYGRYSDYEAHSAVREVLRDIAQLIEITPTIETKGDKID